MLIKIKSCQNMRWWYRKFIGHIFEVVIGKTDQIPKFYIVYHKGKECNKNGEFWTVAKSDAKVLSIAATERLFALNDK